MLRTSRLLLGIGLAVAAAASTAAAGQSAVGPGVTVVLLPVQDRVGDQRAVESVERTVRRGLVADGARVVDRTVTRDLLRELRIRNADAEAPERLRDLAQSLNADRLLSVVIHDAERRGAPALTLSARAYEGSDGRMIWAGFEGGSGLDSRTVLGLGEILDLDALAPRVVGRLVDDLRENASVADGSGDSRRVRLAIVPFDGLTAREATVAADAVTEAARAAAYSLGFAQVPPGCASEVLRTATSVGWGAVDTPVRVGLRQVCDADLVLTGAVERYETVGSPFEPEPRVAIAARVVDADGGRIVWTGSVERGGFDGQGLFRLGRTYALGTLTEKMMLRLARRLQKKLDLPGDGTTR